MNFQDLSNNVRYVASVNLINVNKNFSSSGERTGRFTCSYDYCHSDSPHKFKKIRATYFLGGSLALIVICFSFLQRRHHGKSVASLSPVTLNSNLPQSGHKMSTFFIAPPSFYVRFCRTFQLNYSTNVRFYQQHNESS
jgi:hypothetical protein